MGLRPDGGATDSSPYFKRSRGQICGEDNTARRCRVKWQKVYWLCKNETIPTKSANKNPARRRKRYKIRIVDLKDYLRESAKGRPNTAMLYKEAYEAAPPHVKNVLPKP